ncbi:LytR family transcriptional regulator [Leuconostoc litchii]|uniref:LytR family transcriptional regulator n=1 Tax=Leuconostoc litchii TaxID=1981069 RepID=A0A6P2CN50_9LACO|nr:LCP family protein [Leuconostoc litchii]TYC46385.1 LytR family transcriptional regulator [Leuconostoc litchii]GMA70119.1 LytR family transcriptional regulator [Leuconostoc litchii]
MKKNKNTKVNSRIDRYQPSNHKLRNIILILIGLLVIVTGTFAWLAINNTKSAIDKTYKSSGVTKSRNVSTIVKSGKPLSILLFGTDTGELGRTYKGRTDSMMLLQVNPKSKKTTMISIPRDAMVSIPGYESTFPQKINAAYAYGSTATAIKTVESYLNVPIDFYALVNMSGLEKMVTQVGGISVKSPLDFTYSQETAHDYGDNLYRFHKGSTGYEHSDDNGVTWSATKHIMTGDAALAFSRMRYDDPEGDYGRQKRQRLVLEALIKKSANVSSLLNTKFMNTMSSNVQTDLSFGDLTTIASKYTSAAKNIITEHIQGVSTSYPDSDGNNVSYEVVTQKEKQRVTNLARKALGLKHATTGSAYGGDIPSSLQTIADYLRPDNDESTDTEESSSN